MIFKHFAVKLVVFFLDKVAIFEYMAVLTVHSESYVITMPLMNSKVKFKFEKFTFESR